MLHGADRYFKGATSPRERTTCQNQATNGSCFRGPKKTQKQQANSQRIRKNVRGRWDPCHCPHFWTAAKRCSHLAHGGSRGTARPDVDGSREAAADDAHCGRRFAATRGYFESIPWASAHGYMRRSLRDEIFVGKDKWEPALHG